MNQAYPARLADDYWVARALLEKTFKPHPLFRNGHAQTLAGYAWPRRFNAAGLSEEKERLFEVEPGVRLLAHCRWQPDPTNHPAIILVHGLEGSSRSKYMLGTAEKAFSTGFSVISLN